MRCENIGLRKVSGGKSVSFSPGNIEIHSMSAPISIGESMRSRKMRGTDERAYDATTDMSDEVDMHAVSALCVPRLGTALEEEVVGHFTVAHAAPQVARLELVPRHIVCAQLLDRGRDEHRRERERVVLPGEQLAR